MFFKKRPEVILAPGIFVLVVGLWELYVRSMKISVFLLPPPSLIGKALYEGLVTNIGSPQSIYYHASYTLMETFLGFFIGGITGITLGAVICLFPILERSLLPYIIAFQAMPKVAMAPLFVVWLGFGMTSKVAIVALLTFFPLLVNTMLGLKSVEPEMLDMFRSFGASKWQTFKLLVFPNALPSIFAGLEMAILFGLVGAIIAEFVGGQEGLGVRIIQMNIAFNMEGAFAMFIVLAGIGVGLSQIVNLVRQHVLFWAPSIRRGTGV